MKTIRHKIGYVACFALLVHCTMSNATEWPMGIEYLARWQDYPHYNGPMLKDVSLDPKESKIVRITRKGGGRGVGPSPYRIWVDSMTKDILAEQERRLATLRVDPLDPLPSTPAMVDVPDYETEDGGEQSKKQETSRQLETIRKWPSLRQLSNFIPEENFEPDIMWPYIRPSPRILYENEIITSGMLEQTGRIFNGGHSNPLTHRAKIGKSRFWALRDWDDDRRFMELGLGHNFGALQLNIGLGKTHMDQILPGSTSFEQGGDYILMGTMIPIRDDLWVVLDLLYHRGHTRLERGIDSMDKTDNLTKGIRAQLSASGGIINPYLDLSLLMSKTGAYIASGDFYPNHFNARNSEALTLRLGGRVHKPLNRKMSLIGLFEGIRRHTSRDNLQGETRAQINAPFNFPVSDSNSRFGRASIGVETSNTLVMLNGDTNGGRWISVTWQYEF